MKKKLFKIILSIVIIIAAAAAGFFTGTNWQGIIARSQPQIIVEGIEGKITEIGELSTAEYNYTNVGSFENNLKIKDWDVPLTTKRFIVQYDGLIKAGIDMSRVSVTASAGIITVTLPDAEILSHEIDENSLMVLDETKNIFNRITIDDYNTFAAEQKIICEQMALEKGLLETARANAETALAELISAVPGSDSYQIVFK